MSFSLRLFGAPGIDGPEGAVGGRIAQRHPLALLVLLATAPAATVSREKLLALLWPDSDTEHARGLLNVAVHAVRRALGEAAVRSVGSSLQLDEAVVRSDVRAFVDALAAGEPERAVKAYAGPFLDGFFLDAEAFDAWAEGERARLAGLYAEALERLAQAAEEGGDGVAAAAWWRRRAAVDPCDSRVALRLMQALAAAGDRAGAIQHARVHEALLRESIGAPPSPEITALAERLRTAPAAADAPAPGPATSPSARDVAPAMGADAAARDATGETARGPRKLRPRAARHPGPRNAADPRLPRRPHRLALRAAAGLLMLLAAGAALATYGGGGVHERAGSDPADALPEGPVVAVLPFTNASPGGEEAWRADEMSGEIIAALARLPVMRVVARTSAFAFRDSSLDVREIGGRLGARYVLEGSVGRVGDRLRVHAQLVSVEGGYLLWSGSYNREPLALAAVQDEIARGILGALRLRTRSAAVRPRVRDTEAYELYLQARHASGQRTPDGLARAVEGLQQAIRRDPSFAPAYAGLAECNVMLVGYGALSPTEGYPLARAAAEKALALDPELAEAHAVLALVRLYHDWDFAAAGRAFALAMRHNPSDATVRRWYASYLAYQGRFDEALAAIDRAQRLDPFSPHVQLSAGTILYYAGRYDEALDRAATAVVVDPGLWLGHLQAGSSYTQQGRYPEALAAAERARRASGGHWIADVQRGHVLALSGRRDEALQVVRSLEELAKTQYLSPAYNAIIYAGLGETDAALQWLERAFESRDDWMIYMSVDPALAPLRDDPRFVSLQRRVHPAR